MHGGVAVVCRLVRILPVAMHVLPALQGVDAMQQLLARHRAG
jgi:hypothetical protein